MVEHNLYDWHILSGGGSVVAKSETEKIVTKLFLQYDYKVQRLCIYVFVYMCVCSSILYVYLHTQAVFIKTVVLSEHLV